MLQGLSVLDLPTDILLTILEYVEVPDILSLRLSCHHLESLTKERAVWVEIVKRQQYTLPVPEEYRFNAADDESFQHLETNDIFSFAIRNWRVKQRWPKPRTQIHRWPTEDTGTTSPTILLGMQMVCDKWLLLVYGEGVIQLYDTREPQRQRRVAHMLPDRTQGSQWSSFASAVEHSTNRLVVAASRCVPQYTLTVFSADLGVCENDGVTEFITAKKISLDSPKTVRAIDTGLGLLAVSASSKLQLVSIRNSDSNDDIFVPAYPESHDDLWNGINAVRFMGPYLLVGRTRSIELHHISSALDGEKSMPSFMHSFNLSTFKEASFSDYRIASTSPHGQTYEVSMLVYDVIHGLFQYKVELFVPTSKSATASLDDLTGRPKLTVTQTGLYLLGLPLQNAVSAASMSTTIQSATNQPPHAGGADTPSPTYSQTQFLQNLGYLAHGTSSATSRGFLSTFAMGAQGRRAIWVERKRGGVAREVQVWASRDENDSEEVSADWVFHYGADCKEMERNVVYTINSYDLREDIICCAFSEGAGTIALGNRLGHVSILPLE